MNGQIGDHSTAGQGHHEQHQGRDGSGRDCASLGSNRRRPGSRVHAVVRCAAAQGQRERYGQHRAHREGGHPTEVADLSERHPRRNPDQIRDGDSQSVQPDRLAVPARWCHRGGQRGAHDREHGKTAASYSSDGKQYHELMAQRKERGWHSQQDQACGQGAADTEAGNQLRNNRLGQHGARQHHRCRQSRSAVADATGMGPGRNSGQGEAEAGEPEQTDQDQLAHARFPPQRPDLHRGNRAVHTCLNPWCRAASRRQSSRLAGAAADRDRRYTAARRARCR